MCPMAADGAVHLALLGPPGGGMESSGSFSASFLDYARVMWTRFPSCRPICQYLLLGMAVAGTVALLVPTAAAQSAGDPTSQPGKKLKPSPFKPVGSNPGGVYVPPNDSGSPTDDPSGGGGSGGGNGPGPGGPAQGGTSRVGDSSLHGAPATPSSRGGDTGRGGISGAGSTLTLEDDRWQSWWEANKFDFIELRRIEDPARTGQGVEPETPIERELRLASVRLRIREQVLPVLRELSASDDPSVRSASVVSLGKLHDEASIDLVRGTLADASLDVRRSSMLSLGVLDSGRASWLLMNIADDSRSGRSMVSSSPIAVDDRGVALLTAALRGDHATEPLILQMLSDHDGINPELLSMAAGAAGLMGSAEAIRPLIDIAFDGDLPQGVRSSAIGALGRIGDPSVTPALMELLEGDLGARRASTIALGLVAHVGATRVIDRLGEMLDNESDAVSRHFAAISLGRIGGPIASSHLVAAFKKPRDDMRPWLALALGLCERKTPSGSVSQLLVDRLKDETNTDSQAACLLAIGLCRSDRGLPEMADALRRGRVNIAGAAALALGLSSQAAAATPLREALATSTNVDVLRQAALALGILGDSPSIPALLELIRTTNNPYVASYAAIGIAFMGDANAAGPLLDLIRHQGPMGVTTSYAVSAVGQLFDSDRRPALSRLAAGDNYLARPIAIDDLLDLGF